MFWIGLIVGIVIGLIVMYHCFTSWVFKAIGITAEEAKDMGNLMITACENRESSIVVYNGENELDRVILEEK